MAVRSRRLFGPALVSTAAQVLYTVPSGRTLIVRSIVVYNGSASTAAAIRIHVNGSASTQRLWNTTVAPEATVVFEEPCILNPGDTLVTTAGTTSMRVFVDGSLLFGEPE